MTWKIPGCDIHDDVDVLHLNIVYLMAVGADKVLMMLDITIVVISAAAGGYLGDFPEICQKCEISINCSETDIGIFFTQTAVNCICRRVISTAH